MADPRTFVLIGDFQDNITPALQSINNSIAGLKRTMSAMSTKRGGGFSDVTQSVGKLVSSQKHLADSIKSVGDAAKTATGELKEYKNVVGKIASAHYHLSKAGGQAGDKIASGYDKALASAKKLETKEKTMASTRRQRERSLASAATQPRVSSRSTSSYGGGGGGGGYRGGGHGISGGSFDMARFTLTFGLSEAIAAPITSAITAGFQIGVGMMMKPFEYFLSGMQERMQDEMSDLKAAGGFFSINKMSEKKFLERGSFQEAIDFMQKNNALMAKLAGSLPGSTQDFIEVNKRISDSIAQLVTNAPERAMALAEKIRKEETSTAYSAFGPIKGPPTAKGMQNAMQILMADLTKQTVLAGQGTGGGAQGAMGAYGLPQLTERMLSQQDISMGQMQRYAAIFKDPMIMRNLQKELPKITATMANTPERYEALRVFFEKVLPPELVERYRRTLAGVQETFNTAIFSPETGIFGLGRKMKQLGGAFDEFGRMLDENGQITKDITEQARIDIDLYGLFRDILVNLGRVLAPIVENLSAFWDPLLNVGKLLEKARVVTFEVVRSFEIYNKSFGNFAKTLSDTDLQKFSQTGGKELRASLATIANLFRQFGVISDQDFQSIFDKLVKVDMSGGEIFKELLDKFLKSDVAKQIGEFVGTLIGTVLSEVSQVTGFLSGRIAGSGKLFEGLKKGFNDAGGPAAFSNIFKDVFAGIFKVMVEVAKLMPLEGWILGALMLTLPVAIQTFAMVLAEKISSVFYGGAAAKALGGGGGRGGILGAIGKSFLPGVIAGAPAAKGRVPDMKRGTTLMRGVSSPAFRAMPSRTTAFPQVALPGAAPLGVGGVGGMYRAPSVPKKITPLSRTAMGPLGSLRSKGVGSIAGAMLSLSAQAPKLAKAGRAVGNIARALPGGAIAFGALDAGLRMMDGQGAGKAIGGAAASTTGSIAGAALGSLIAPGIGTAIGGIAGGIIGDKLFSVISDKFSTPAQIQKNAADKQMAASLQQLQASNRRLAGLGVETPAGAQGIADPMKLGATIKMLGLESDKLVITYQQNVERARMLSDQTQAAKDALFSKVEELKKLGYSPELIWQQADIKALQKDYTGLQKTLGEASKAVDTSFKAMPQHVSRAIATNMQKMSLKQSEDILAAKFANMKVPEFKFNFTGQSRNMYSTEILTGPNPPSPGAPSLLPNFNPNAIPGLDPNNPWGEGLPRHRFTSRKNWGEGCSVGSLGSGNVSSVDSFNSIARSAGLSLTSGYRPGSKGWHGVNRARDYSNGFSPTPQMMEFAQNLIAQYGSNLKELIYTPLGYSIKDGRKVPPIAASGHYNHVHVAYGLGQGNPAFFSSQSAAERWEKSMVSGSVRVGSVTGNSAEGFGSGTSVVNNITINQQPGQNADELASIVAMKIGEAVADARAASIFV